MSSLNHNFSLGARDDSNGFMQLQDLEERAHLLFENVKEVNLDSVVSSLAAFCLGAGGGDCGLYSGCGGRQLRDLGRAQ